MLSELEANSTSNFLRPRNFPSTTTSITTPINQNGSNQGTQRSRRWHQQGPRTLITIHRPSHLLEDLVFSCKDDDGLNGLIYRFANVENRNQIRQAQSQQNQGSFEQAHCFRQRDCQGGFWVCDTSTGIAGKQRLIRSSNSLAPYERRVIELLRNSKDKRARKLAKKRVCLLPSWAPYAAKQIANNISSSVHSDVLRRRSMSCSVLSLRQEELVTKLSALSRQMQLQL